MLRLLLGTLILAQAVKVLACDRKDSDMEDKVNLSAPWVTLYREFEALFGSDPDVKLEYIAADGNDPIIKMYVDGQDKADAIAEIVPDEYDFGGVKVTVVVVPANRATSKEALFRTAFEGNPAFSYAVTAEGIFTNPVTYVVFKNKVVQFWNDDLGDVNGNETTLYETIAANMLYNNEGVCFCTDTPENLGAPVKNLK